MEFRVQWFPLLISQYPRYLILRRIASHLLMVPLYRAEVVWLFITATVKLFSHFATLVFLQSMKEIVGMPRSHLVEDFASRLATGVREKDENMLLPKVSGTCDCHVTKLPHPETNPISQTFTLLAATSTYCITMIMIPLPSPPLPSPPLPSPPLPSPPLPSHPVPPERLLAAALQRSTGQRERMLPNVRAEK